MAFFDFFYSKLSTSAVDNRTFLVTLIGLFIGGLILIIRRRRLLKDVPVLAPNSILGFTKALLNSKPYDSHQTMLDLAEKYGKLFQFRFLNQHIVVVNDKFMAKEALKNVHGKGFFHRGNPSLNWPTTFNLDTNTEWQMRRIAFRSAFSMNHLRYHADFIQSLCMKLTEILDNAVKEKSVVEIDKLFGQLTVDVICEIAFQLNINALSDASAFQDIHDHIRTIFELRWIGLFPFLYRLPFKPFSDYMNARNSLKQFCRSIRTHLQILEVEGALKPKSLAEAIVKFSQEPGITEEDVIAEITLMFVAGHETTAHTLSWFMYAMAKNVDIQLRCQQEINDANISAEHSCTDGLPAYVEACLKESMRKYPVAASGSIRLVRESPGYILHDVSDDQGNELPGTAEAKTYLVHKGSWILVNLFALHNSTHNWGADALQYKPERWLSSEDVGQVEGEWSTEGGEELKVSDNQKSEPSILKGYYQNPLASPAVYGGGGMTKNELAFAPFSYGPRSCLGMNLALMETRITLATLLKKFTFTLAEDNMADETVALENKFTLMPHNRLRMRVVNNKLMKAH